jgi:hypothetical protein
VEFVQLLAFLGVVIVLEFFRAIFTDILDFCARVLAIQGGKRRSLNSASDPGAAGVPGCPFGVNRTRPGPPRLRCNPDQDQDSSGVAPDRAGGTEKVFSTRMSGRGSDSLAA